MGGEEGGHCLTGVDRMGGRAGTARRHGGAWLGVPAADDPVVDEPGSLDTGRPCCLDDVRCDALVGGWSDALVALPAATRRLRFMELLQILSW
jgi:hypothetical protein